MLRLTLIELVLFLSPFAIYGAWRLLQTTVPDNPRRMPSILLGLVGGFLAAIGLIALVILGERGRPEDGRYVPAQVEDGRVRHSDFSDTDAPRNALPGRPFGTGTTQVDEDPGAFDAPDSDPQPEPDVPDDAEIDAPPEQPIDPPVDPQ